MLGRKFDLFDWFKFIDRINRVSKELSHGILNYFGHVQNYLDIEGNLKIIVY